LKKIVVLGSKPDAQWPEADEIYCANGAIGFYARELSTASNVVNVVSARILNKSKMLHEKSGSDFYSSKLSAICDANPSRMILVGSIATPDLAIKMGAWLKLNGYESPIEYMDHASRVSAQQQLTGLPYPIPLKTLFQGSLLMAIYDLLDLTLLRLGLKKGEVNRKYRPSTGIIALLIAIQEHGEGAQYVIAGIGLSQRNIHHVNGQQKSIASKQDRTGMEPHVAADKVVIAALARRYRLQSAESSIDALIKAAHD
jgi:hypothetical protein